ncbi:MAG: vacuolar-type H+-ATPase catalytic subunit A/Vma1 [Paracoccaceae bacterium]|jgi:vacuolar-type H+-ATPase catalytic subunit A/Vma1
MITSQRLNDRVAPILQGEAAYGPGLFGAAKTVLSNLILRHVNVDMVIVRSTSPTPPRRARRRSTPD